MAEDSKERGSSWVVKVLVVSQICSIACLAYLLVIVSNLQERLILQELKDQQTNIDENRYTELHGTTVNTLPSSTQKPDESNQLEIRSKRQVSHSCGGNFSVDRNQDNVYRINSPNYPANYPSNIRCQWEFILSFPSPSNYAGSSELDEVFLEITFPTPIFIESHRSCGFDALEIRGGSQHGPLLGTYCGMNTTIPAVSFAGPVYILFRTDRFGEGKGFQAVVSVRRAFLPRPGPTRGPGSGAQSKEDATFTRWGRRTCPSGRTFYDGFAIGMRGSVASALQCAPLPAQIQFSDVNVSNTSPQLTAARFDLNGIDGALSSTLSNKPIRCALCHVRRTTTFMVIGWTSCNGGGWVTAYTGYLMTAWRRDGVTTSFSEPICMDSSPEEFDGYGVEPSAPKVTYVKSGTGLWIEDKLVPCAVCIRGSSS